MHHAESKRARKAHSVETDINWHRNIPSDEDHESHSTESQDKGSLNAFRTLLNYGMFNGEKLTDDTYGHARPYNLVLMSTRSLWIIYVLFFIVIISATIFSFKQDMFINDKKVIEMPSFALFNNNASLLSHGYNPSDQIFNDPSTCKEGQINKSIANLYFHNDSFFPYQEYIYLYGRLSLHDDINLSDPFISNFLSGTYLFNYSVLLNITNNRKVLGFENKYMEDTTFFRKSNPCSIDSECVFDIWSPYDDDGFSASWQNTILYDYKSKPNPAMLFNTSIVFYNFNLNNFGTFSLSYVYEKENWVQFEFYTKCSFFGVTMISLILWCYRIARSKHRKDLIAEQRWMVVLFLALLLYQDPLTIGLFTSDSFDAVYLISSLFFATSINLFMIYWSLMIDSIRQIKNLIDVGVSFGCKFYRFKLIAACLSYASSLVFTLATQYLIQNNTENNSYNGYFYAQSDHLVVMTVIVSGSIWICCVSCFVLWLFKSLWNANKELNKLPYIETRERQLSLRHFKHYTFIAMLYILIMSLYNVYSHRSPLVLVDNRRTDMSLLIVVSFYVYLVAFMYMPMTRRNIKMAQHNFQLSDAILMCHISWQSYLAPHKNDDDDDDDDDDNERIQTVDLEHFNLELIQFVTNKVHDMQIIISKGHIHKLFKKQKAQIHINKTCTNHQKQLLLAPKQSERHQFLEDVSSDDEDTTSSSSYSQSIISEVESTSSQHPNSSILSFDGIKTLFKMNKHKRSQSAFNRYGATEQAHLSIIKDDDERMPDASTHLQQKAFSLFSGKRSYTDKVNEKESPLLTSYEENISSFSSAAAHIADEEPPISVEYRDDYHAPSLLHEEHTDLESVVTVNADEDSDDNDICAVSKQLNGLLDRDRYRQMRAQTVMNKNEYEEEEEKIDNRQLMYTQQNKKRSSTITTHKLKNKKKKKKKNKRRHAFRIPLLSNLLPQDLYRNRSRNKANLKYTDIVIGFRGTDSSVNVKLDLKFRRMTIGPSFWYQIAFDDSITQRKEWKKCVRPSIVNMISNDDDNPLNIPFMKIHSGFYQSFADIQCELIDTLLTTYYEITKKKKRIARFYVTGHSLGGALAQLCGLCLEMLFGHESSVNVYVYGCPRVGDKHFSDYLKQKVKHLYRVVFRGDIVTTIPRGFAYYKHGGYEMVIDEHGNMINNPSRREKALLPSRKSLKDHQMQNYVDALNAIAKKHELSHLIVQVPNQ